MSAKELVGRLAPSPTGLLHVGHARSFLLAWWSVRSRGGRMLLRVEDLDRTRVKPGMTEACIEDLRWLGLDWDGPVRVQSEETADVRAALERLDELGLLYPCVCTRKEIELARSAPHAEEPGEGVYPGTCRGRFASTREARSACHREPALRVRVPPDEIHTEDLLHGPRVTRLDHEVGDFPVTSRDGQVAYQLAVVVDDASQGVTEVLRGEDLLESTARQAFLLDSLGFPGRAGSTSHSSPTPRGAASPSAATTSPSPPCENRGCDRRPSSPGSPGARAWGRPSPSRPRTSSRTSASRTSRAVPAPSVPLRSPPCSEIGRDRGLRASKPSPSR